MDFAGIFLGGVAFTQKGKEKGKWNHPRKATQNIFRPGARKGSPAEIGNFEPFDCAK
jgi:hypothetical protein